MFTSCIMACEAYFALPQLVYCSLDSLTFLWVMFANWCLASGTHVWSAVLLCIIQNSEARSWWSLSLWWSLQLFPLFLGRSHKEKRSSYAPEAGVRYDGVYRIEKCWRKKGIQAWILWLCSILRDSKTGIAIANYVCSLCWVC